MARSLMAHPLVRSLVLLASAIAAVGAAIHLAGMLAGPAWLQFFHAPPAIVASAREGSWLAPLAGGVIALLMATCAVYAASAAGLLRPLPWRRTMLAGMAAICLLRALVLVPLALAHPELWNRFEIVAALVWGMAGVGFALGLAAAIQGRASMTSKAAGMSARKAAR